MSYETSSKQGTPSTTGFPFLDMMLQMQKASQQALSSFIPPATNGVQASSAQTARTRFDQRTESKIVTSAPRTSNSVEVIPVGEESFHVGTRTVQGETTRLRRVVIETPVEQQVSLRTETVIVERRKPASSVATGDVLSERQVEMSDSFQVAETWKSVHLREEVVLRTEVVERTETVRDTVRRDEVQVEQARTAPRAQIEAPKRAEASRAAVEQLAADASAPRPATSVRPQDATPPAAVQAGADRPSPAPAPARPQSEANAQPSAQSSQPAAPQPENKPASSPVTSAQPDNKPSTPPRPENNQADKAPGASSRRA